MKKILEALVGSASLVVVTLTLFAITRKQVRTAFSGLWNQLKRNL